MIDLILHAPDRTTMRQFGIANGLLYRPVESVTVDPETLEETITYGDWELRPGVSFSWWNGTGQLMRSRGTYDADGNELTPPQYVNGQVSLIRIGGAAGNDDVLSDTPVDPDDVKEWERSKIARYIRNNGTPGEAAGMSYYEIDGIRIFRRKDVNAKLAEWDVPGHEYL